MAEFKLTTEDGDRVCCAACQYPAPVAKYPAPPHLQPRDDHWFCQFCVTTFVSNTYSYPTQYADGAAAQAVGHAFNAIVDGLSIDRSKMWEGE